MAPQPDVLAHGESRGQDATLVPPVDDQHLHAQGLAAPVGPGDFQDGERLPMDVEVGDLVVYSKYGGTEVKFEGEDYLILSSRDVLAVIR